MNHETLNKPSQADLLQAQIELIRKSYADQRSITLFLETYPLSLELGKVKGETSQQVREKELERISDLETDILYKKDVNFKNEFHSMGNYHPDLSMQRIIIRRDEELDSNHRLTKDAADSIAHYAEARRLDTKIDNMLNGHMTNNVREKITELRTASNMIKAEGKSLHARDVQNQLATSLGDKANAYIAHIRGTNSIINPVRPI